MTTLTRTNNDQDYHSPLLQLPSLKEPKHITGEVPQVDVFLTRGCMCLPT